MTSSSPLVVQVCHDDPILAAGLSILIGVEPDLAVQAETAAQGQAVDVIVADYSRAIRLLEAQSENPSAGHGNPTDLPHIVIFTRCDRESEVLRAVERGAHAYLLQESPPDELLHAIRHVARGGARYLCRLTAILMAAHLLPTRFTTREQEVLRLLIRGECNKGIARQLEISANTVKAHVSSICEKLQVRTRTQVAVEASNRGFACA
jgi:two-component system nitrate/nitrite response regulator NarL